MSAALALDDCQAEMRRQDVVHPAGYPATRDGIRLGLAVAQDELEEALEAWARERCKCPTPMCDHARWSDTRQETIQAAALLLRIVTNIPAPEETPVGQSQVKVAHAVTADEIVEHLAALPLRPDQGVIDRLVGDARRVIEARSSPLRRLFERTEERG